MDVKAQAGSKHTRDEEEKDDPLTATKRKMAETTRRIKDNKKKALRQPTLRFAAAVDGSLGPPPTKHKDEAKVRKSAAARTQTMLDEREEFIQCETKATPVLAPKQAVRSDIVTLIEKPSQSSASKGTRI